MQAFDSFRNESARLTRGGVFFSEIFLDRICGGTSLMSATVSREALLPTTIGEATRNTTEQTRATSGASISSHAAS